MKILVYGNRKQDDEYYDISTPEKRKAAYLLLFKNIDDCWGVYDDLKEYKPSKKKSCEPCSKDLCRVCEGDNCYCDKTTECAIRSRRSSYEELESADQQKWYKEAKKGNAESAIRLLQARGSYEYEEVREEEVIDPLESRR